VVCPPDYIDPERFGVIVARGLGLDGNVFEREDEAREWLRHSPGPGR
jgi:hypothetical protein